MLTVCVCVGEEGAGGGGGGGKRRNRVFAIAFMANVRLKSALCPKSKKIA